MLEIGLGDPGGPGRRRRAGAPHRLRPRRGADRDRRRRGARVGLDPRPMFFGRTGVRRALRWDTSTRPTSPAMRGGTTSTRPDPARPGRESRVREVEPWREGQETWRRSRPSSPPDIDTHCARQTFYYDRELRLRRHDYTAEVVGRWAHAAHMCADHVEVGAWCFRPGAASCRGGPATGRCRSRRWWPCSSRRSRFNERLATRPLAHPRLALQREGALGARPQGGRARAPRAASGRPHGDRPLAHPRASKRPFPCCSSTAATSATRPRSSRRWRTRWPERAALSRGSR